MKCNLNIYKQKNSHMKTNKFINKKKYPSTIGKCNDNLGVQWIYLRDLKCDVFLFKFVCLLGKIIKGNLYWKTRWQLISDFFLFLNPSEIYKFELNLFFNI